MGFVGQLGGQRQRGQVAADHAGAVGRRGAVVRADLLGAGGVALVEAAHRVQHQGAVFGGAGHGAGLVQRGGEGDHAETRAAAVGGLDAGDAGERCGLADRTTGVGAGGGRHQARGHSHGRATRGAAGDASGVPGVAGLGVSGVLVGAAHGELVAVELAHVDHASSLELGHDGGVEGALVALEHLGGGRGGQALRHEDVLVRDRHAVQLAEGLARGAAGV